LINTLFSKNLPGEITLPVNNILKSTEKTKGFEGEEILPSIPVFRNHDEIIVDNEDSGFINKFKLDVIPLRKLLGIKQHTGEVYGMFDLYNPPEYWQPVIRSTYFGRYVLSSVYTRSGTGDRSVTWKTKISGPGYYDVYCYIGKTGGKITVSNGGAGAPPPPDNESDEKNMYKELHYRIFSDAGVDEIAVDYDNAENGWNSLGRYHLSADSAKVMLTNKSAGKIVIGDAVKWVKTE
jgi:hypothetical protein